MPRSLLIIRIRGYASTPWNIQQTLEMLRLPRRFNAMIYPDTKDIKGMLIKVQPYVTWGELNEEGAELILSKLKTLHHENINDEYVKKYFGITKEDLKQKIVNGEIKINKYSSVFLLPIRLHAPSGGFKGKINAPYKNKGEFGYRGIEINNLLRRMI
ncbi:50S ribosomal protein L30 [Acidianus sulfidivorans JP7]|uniref:Large ribosomal subunit protein uL30 n=1 Tax=Acidianus sulfidivorans JP7 TaxID=619593 RepID=A0A2U9IMP7_9CREN|nr:50S ribosomal protein L30 [Acidianus sulfidivorans]AWR97301.1 50S ribosomal protein L30 [Acidianus sulfidivorans JP7]